MIQRLLRGRTFYLFLGILILLLYLRTMSGGTLQPMEVDPALHDAPAPEWLLEVPDPTTLKQAASRHQPLGILLAVLIGLMGVMAFGGFLFTFRGLSKARRSSFWQFSAAPVLPWSFGELGRVIFLAVTVALLLPFVRLALLAYAPLWRLDSNLWIPLAMLVLDAFVIVTILAFVVGKQQSTWAMLGTSGRGVKDSIRVGFVSYVTMFPWLVILLLVISEVARTLGFQPPLEPIHRLLFLEQRPGVLLLTILLTCIIGPVAEELFFRGVVYAAIRSRTSRLIAMLLSGGLFAVTHTNLMGFLPIAVLGCLLAYLYERTGSLAASMIVHMFHNSLLLVFAMMFRYLLPSG